MTVMQVVLSCVAVVATAGSARGDDAPATGPAITNGVLDEGDPGVVAITLGSFFRCTGTLVSSRVVVTAAHCIGQATAVVFGPDPATGVAIEILHQRAHPAFDAEAYTADIGVLLLAADAPLDATPWPLRRPALDDSFAGTELRLVGFGAVEAFDATPPLKREGTALASQLGTTRFKYVAGPAQSCTGDSGGPVFAQFDDGDEQLVGVTSSGDAACADFAFATRVDVFADEFVVPFIEFTSAGAADNGQRCYYAQQCASGDCLDDAEAGHAYCTSSCQADGECVAAMFCVDGSCRLRRRIAVSGGCALAPASTTSTGPVVWTVLAALLLRRRRRR